MFMEQIERAVVTSRQNSGGGYFTDLCTDENLPPLLALGSVIGRIWFYAQGFDQPLGAMLFLENGWLSMLEVYACGEETSSLDLVDLHITDFIETE